MNFKVIKTRKPHTCMYCSKEIPAGSQAKYSEGRLPKIDYQTDTQIGLEFFKDYAHHETDCDETIKIEFRGQVLLGKPFFWSEDQWGWVCLEIQGKETADGNCFYQGRTMNECMEQIIAGEYIDPEWERQKREAQRLDF